MYCKDLVSLSVLSLYEGELIGQVDKLYFDKKLKKLCEIELIGADGVRLRLNTKHIYNVGKNAITVKNNQCVELRADCENFCACPIGSKAYSLTGEFLGVVSELEINEKYLTQKILLENGEFLLPKDIASCGKNTIIFYCDKKVNLQTFVPKGPKILKKKEVQKVEVLPAKEEKPQQETEKKQTNSSSNFLLGRICTKDIYNFNNELLIKENAVVNKKNLKEISKFGKLKELMIYSK